MSVFAQADVNPLACIPIKRETDPALASIALRPHFCRSIPRPTIPGSLSVTLRGAPGPNPSSNSRRTQPPAIPVVDTLSLKARADATLIVARAGRTQQSVIDDAVRILGQDHILGVILNAVEKFDRGYYEYYRHYAPQNGNNAKPKS